jgi:catechol 2,3-dioxygenase-like lactoylglutathione lyase family enzyme
MSSSEANSTTLIEVPALWNNDFGPTYLAAGDPARRLVDFNSRKTTAGDYRPVWLDRLAENVTLEGSAMIGAVRGREAVRSIVTYIRTLYENQTFNFAGPCGDTGFIEDYNARLHGQPIGNVVLIARNAAGEAQHIAASYRPRNAVQLLSRLMRKHFAGTAYSEYFAASEQLGAGGMRLEVVTLPVSDVERSKHFYQGLGWRLDADIVRGSTFRAVQLTPPQSSCSIVFGNGLSTASPGSVQRLELVVYDIDAAREDLIGRGTVVSEVYHLDGGRVPGPDPQRRSYQSYASFADPDGNTWVLQEVRERLPGRLWDDD